MDIKISRRLAIPCLVLLFLLTNGCQQKGRQPAPQRPRFTLESFEQVQEGMTIEDVKEILGQPQDSGQGKATMKFVGVDVTELAQWSEGSGAGKRQLEIGFSEGKVAAAIYRAGDVTRIKPEVPEGRFRVVAGRHSLGSPTTLRVVADFGSPESSLVHFGIGESNDEIEGFDAITPPKRVEFTISGELLDQPQGDSKVLEITLERHDPKATFTRKFAIDKNKQLSELAFAHVSDIYEPGESIMLGRLIEQSGTTYKILLNVVEKPGE